MTLEQARNLRETIARAIAQNKIDKDLNATEIQTLIDLNDQAEGQIALRS